MNLNKVFLIGNLTRDPELKSTPSGQSVVTVGLATNRRWTDPSGQKHEEAEFHNVVLWRRLAEIATKFLKKGSLVYIEGRLKTRSWQGQDGQKRYITEIIAENLQMGPRGGEKFSGGESHETGRDEVRKEELPEINLDEEASGEENKEINPADIPF